MPMTIALQNQLAYKENLFNPTSPDKLMFG